MPASSPNNPPARHGITFCCPASLDLPSLAVEIYYILKNSEGHYGGGEDKGRKDGEGGNCLPANISGNSLRSIASIAHFLEHFINTLTKAYYETPSHFVQMPSWIMESVYKRYDRILPILIKNKIIELNLNKEGKGRYVTAKKSDVGEGICKSYRLSSKPLKIVVKPISHIDLVSAAVKRIDSIKYKSDKSLPKSEVQRLEMEFIKNNLVVGSLEDWQTWDMDITTLYSDRRILNQLKRGIVNLTESGKVQRVHHLLCILSSQSRKRCIEHKDGRSFACVDWSTAHTYIVEIAFLDEPDELVKQGADLYLPLAEELGITRDEFKHKRYLNYALNGFYRPSGRFGRVLKKVLPRLYVFLIELNRNQRKELSNILLEEEAKFMWKVVGNRLIAEDIPHYTVHDGIYAVSGYENKVKQIMEEASLEEYKYKGRFKIG